MKATTVIADTRPQSPYPRLTEWRPHTHPIQTAESASTLHTPQTPHPQSTHPRHIADPASTPVLAPHRPQTSHSYLTSPLTRRTPAHTSRTPHSSYPPCIHSADPALTLHPPHTPSRLRSHATYLAHPRLHIHSTHHRPRSHHAHTPRSPRAHSRLRVRRARSQLSRSSCRRSRPRPPHRAAPAGRGG